MIETYKTFFTEIVHTLGTNSQTSKLQARLVGSLFLVLLNPSRWVHNLSFPKISRGDIKLQNLLPPILLDFVVVVLLNCFFSLLVMRRILS